jgi:hypothetical protein
VAHAAPQLVTTMFARWLAFALLLAPAAACGTTTANATSGPYTVALTGSGDDGDDGGTLGPPHPDAGGAPFCSGSGPPVTIPGASAECTGDLGRRTFLFAVCACKDVLVSGRLATDSLATASSNGTGGSIGANGAVHANSDLDVRGSIWAGGATGNPAIQTVQLGSVDGDVHANGDVVASATLTVSGALHVAANANVSGVVAASTVREPTAPPCDCTSTLPIGTIVASFANDNDDATASLTPTSFATAPAAPITLPCGRYYFDSIDGDSLTLSLTGRTAIFVAGDVHLGSSLQVNLADGAELDLFVGGDLRLHDATIGSESAPARTRVYVAGANFLLDGTAHLGVNLYAPHADVQLSGDQQMSGSLFVDDLQLSGAFTIHYDESILATAGCGAPIACTGGAACTTDSDCCAPLKCRAKSCAADVR